MRPAVYLSPGVIAAVVLVIAWAYRTLFALSDTLMVFVLENSQDRDSIAMQA
ncbi:hypothetical protein SAMN05216459_12662 [Ensifer sp. OV372]|jgi:hypothetical protein|nr:hypothetical protein SAMN05216459_12662 [Ensifer sp. OV372]